MEVMAVSCRVCHAPSTTKGGKARSREAPKPCYVRWL